MNILQKCIFEIQYSIPLPPLFLWEKNNTTAICSVHENRGKKLYLPTVAYTVVGHIHTSVVLLNQNTMRLCG